MRIVKELQGKFKGLEMEVCYNNYVGERNAVVRRTNAGTKVFDCAKKKLCS